MRDILQSTLHKRYHLERELGKGGMGAVYLATDLQLQRLVAIKVLPPELAVRPELRERFLRETRLAAGFSHPNIVAVHAVEDHPQLLAFVMGFVEGETLGQRVRRAGPLGGPEAVRMLQEVAWALSYAHGRGVVHRDIKPDNILIERATGRALLTDFGIARSSAAGVSNLTQVGEVVGTPQFMSPEQAAGEPLDGRSDLYSLGVVAFFAVTGRLPFEASSAGAVMAMHLTQTPPKVASLRPDLSQALCAAIDRCLEKDPAQRFESGEALAAALDPIRSARREVSPAVRMFQLQSTQAARVTIIVGFTGTALFRNVLGEDNGMAMIFGIITVTVLWAVAAQIVGRARYLLTLGYTFDEVSSGLGVIIDERDEARAQERANPMARKREAARMRAMIISFVLSVAGTWYAFNFTRTKIADGYHTGLLGLSLLAVCAGLFGFAIALLMMNPARSAKIDKQIAKVWRGRFGKTVFRIAGWHLERETAQLQHELRSLANKQRELESALSVVSSEVRAADTKSGATGSR